MEAFGIAPAKALETAIPADFHVTTMKTMNEHCIKVCNRLLRGEISAVETYGQAIEKFPDSPVSPELRRIRSEHETSVSLLEQNVRSMGGEQDRSSGAWGTFATTVQGTANLFGDNSAIGSLQRGEEAGRSDYQDALLDDDVMPESKTLIREKLLPPVMKHIASLERLEQTA